MEIINYLKIKEGIQTSGQPKVDDFAAIRVSGVHTVINLAMPDSETALSDEGKLVSENGMNYIHIPVVWKSPKEEQYTLFTSVMELHSKKSIWIHCALNWRVASFMYLYSTKHLGIPEKEARKNLESIWTPNKTWSEFIKNNS